MRGFRKFRRIRLALLGLAFSLCSPIEGAETTSDQRSAANKLSAAIEDFAAQEMENSGTPSLQIAIGSKGRVVFEGAYGWADLENKVPATSKSRYRTASVSKWFTAIAAMKLAEAGKLDLDAPIQRYCSSYPKKRWTITTRQLLTHTSGIRHYIDYEEKLAEASTDEERGILERKKDRAQLSTYTRYTDIESSLTAFKSDPLNFKPGTQWQYSSFGYRVLACVMEGAAAKPFRSILRDSVFIPTLMPNTVEDDAWAIVPGRVSGYRLIRGAALRRADLRDVSENLPAGGHLSTATDLVLLAEAFRTGKLLPQETIKEMFTPAESLRGTPSWRDAIPSKEKYGYGLMFFPTEEHFRYGHSGRQAGGSAIVVTSPDQELSIALLTNAKGWNGYMRAIEAIERLFLDAYSRS